MWTGIGDRQASVLKAGRRPPSARMAGWILPEKHPRGSSHHLCQVYAFSYTRSMAWNVEGNDQFTDWYLSLDAAETGRIDAAVELLEEHGPALGRPLVDTVTGSAFANMKEPRVSTGSGQLRVLFIFDPRRTAIVLLGGNKAGQWQAWYTENIPIADQLYREYLAELRQEGLIE